MLEFQLVLPCYNESKSLSFLVMRAKEAAIQNGFNEKSFGLVLVENGSRDNSKVVLEQLKKSELGNWFQVVHVHPNVGYGNGVFQGLKTTSARYVGWSHADQQCDPLDAFKAYSEVMNAKDSQKTVVKGHRHGRDPKDQFVSWVFQTLAKLFLGFPIKEINAQPKVFHRNLLQHLKNPPLNFSFDLYVLVTAARRGYAFKSIPVKFPPRIHGVSNWAGTFFGRYKTILGMIGYMWKLRSQKS